MVMAGFQLEPLPPAILPQRLVFGGRICLGSGCKKKANPFEGLSRRGGEMAVHNSTDKDMVIGEVYVGLHTTKPIQVSHAVMCLHHSFHMPYARTFYQLSFRH